MKNGLIWVIAVVLLAMGAWYFSMREDQSALEDIQMLPAPLDAEIATPEPRYPVERVVAPEPESNAPSGEPEVVVEPPAPLPTLAQSDAEIIVQAQQLLPEGDLASLLVPEFVLSRLVATIDGLDAARLPQPMRPLNPVPGRFEVLEVDGEAVISPANGARYRPFLDLVEAVDVDTAVALYVRYYPLLQEAYMGLGDQSSYFNDRVIEILDLLLATPEPPGMIELRQNEAVYEFLDPDLEALAVGQKAMLRLQADDRQALREKLAQLRAALAGAETTPVQNANGN